MPQQLLLTRKDHLTAAALERRGFALVVVERVQCAHQRSAFNVFDADRNGSIDRAELRTMLTKMKLLPADHSDAAFESMWKLADTNKDGQISFEEFVKIFHRDSSENK